MSGNRCGKLQPDPTTAAAVELLRVHREVMARERRNRVYLVGLARQHGLTNAAIGEALGVSEAAVRRFIQRQEAAA